MAWPVVIGPGLLDRVLGMATSLRPAGAWRPCADPSGCCPETTTVVVMERPAAAVYPAGARMSVRVLDDWELVWLLRGRATLTGDPGLELWAGDLVVIPPGHPHGF